MGYTPMPAHLDQQLQNVVREISSAQADAGNTIFVIREALAQAYATGHKDAHSQAMSHQWLTEDLKKTFDARKAALKAAKDAAPKMTTKAEDHA
jgi:flagellar biosynthesis/type III secretory pathway protein FliH